MQAPVPTLSLTRVVSLFGLLALPLACSGQADGDSVAAPSRESSVPSRDGPWFVAGLDESGLSHRNLSGPTATQGKVYLLDCTGPGLATFDFDGDGDLDLFFPQGRADSSALDGSSAQDEAGGDCADRLYRNLGGRRFEECAAEVGLADRGYGFGALAFDYDADADDDLFVTNFGPNRLYRNTGGRFTDVTAEHPGLEGAAEDWSTGAAAGDVDGDGDLDLYVCNYLRHDRPELDAKGPCSFLGSCAVPCGPLGLEPQASALFLNGGPPDCRFVLATEASGLAVEPSYSFQPVFTDVDDDGDLDLYVSNDSMACQLFINDGAGHFSECGLLAGVATGATGQYQAGMGVACRDVQGDLLPELYVTAFSMQVDSLYVNLSRDVGRPWFEERSVRSGCGHPTYFTLAWGCSVNDFDQDGWPDIFVANGHVYPQVDECATREVVYRQSNLLFRGVPGEPGRFQDVSAGAGAPFTTPGPHRGSAAADLDDDGDLDLVIVRLDEAPLLAWNETPRAGHWLQLLLLTADGRRAIGARVLAEAGGRRWSAESHAGSSYLSTEDPRVHLGLGGAAVLDRLTVRFPDGSVWSDEHVAADRLLTIRAGSSPAHTASLGEIR